MGKLALVALVGQNDQGIQLSNGAYQHVASIPFFKHGSAEDVSVHEFLTALKKLKLEPSELAMDLLVIACTMYAADTRIERKIYADDSWTRMIDLFIPVSNQAFWHTQKGLLQRIFRFLTGDIWELNFRERSDPSLVLSPRGNRQQYKMPYQTDTVCLFSGGMDSLIGAIDLLEQGIQPLLVGHSKSNDVAPYQENCYNAIKTHYTTLAPEKIYAFVRVPKNNLFGSEDHTERGRSFLFLTLGSICASALQQQSRLIVPENGMISLNIPLTPLRVGSHSTRTTHPHYFSMMQELFNNMQSGVVIQNPYQFKTKGEMLMECSNNALVAQTESMSCSHPSGRWEGQGNGHCGYCVPCIIRQAAFKAAGLTDRFPYRRNIFAPTGVVIKKAEGADILAFKYQIEKIRQKPAFLTAAIRSTGPLRDDVTPYVEVYKRALDEVENLLEPIVLI
jgi:7-cyano-7-deazaguanine synthase in queuosine biosynthesis